MTTTIFTKAATSATTTTAMTATTTTTATMAITVRTFEIATTDAIILAATTVTTALLLEPWSTLQTSSFWPLVSHAGESCYVLWLGLLSPLSRPTILLCRYHPSYIQYFMRGRVSPINVHASDSSALLLGPWTTLQTSPFLPSSVSHAGESLPIKVCAFDSSALLSGPWSILQVSSNLSAVSHAGAMRGPCGGHAGKFLPMTACGFDSYLCA